MSNEQQPAKGWTQTDKLMLTLNSIAAVIYVVVASKRWLSSQERAVGIQPTGEPFVWFFTAVPIFAIFVLVDFIWAIRIVVRRRWRHTTPWLVSGLIWSIALWIDFAHH
jgi:hypothetical protein